MADTEHFGIPKPRETDNIDAEMRRLQAAWDIVDEILNTFLTGINSKAPSSHSHSIDQVSGLALALAGKMSSSRTFSLAELTDVVGYVDAPQGYIPVKNADGKVSFLSAAAAIGNHQHSIGDIVDLAAALSARMRWFAAGEALPTENVGPIWHETYKSVMTWQAFTANGASHTGYASAEIGRPVHDRVLRTGYLKANGADIQKTVYPALFNWARHNGLLVPIGSWTSGPFVFQDNGDGNFRIPDLRGEFFRSADDGRGVDSGRAHGSWQAHMTASHSHGVNDPGHNHGVNDPGHVHGGVQNGQSSTGRSTSVDQPPAVYSFGNTWGATTGIWLNGSGTGISIQAAGGVETRPRNTAFVACIKF